MASVQGAGMVQAAPKDKVSLLSPRSKQKSGSDNFSDILGRLKKSPRSGKNKALLLTLKGKASQKKIPAELADITAVNVKKGKLGSEETDLLKSLLKKESGHSLSQLRKKALKELMDEDKKSKAQDSVPLQNIPGLADAEEAALLKDRNNELAGELVEKTSGKEISKDTGRESVKKVELEITLVDLRTEKSSRDAEKNLTLKGKDKKSPVEAKQDLAKLNPQIEKSAQSTVKEHSFNEKDFLSELKSPDGVTYAPQGSGGKVEIPMDRQAVQNFQDHLTRSGNADIVRNMKVILKDNNAGEIKLILKPESLGNVRIQLSMNENNIVGKIVVDNQSIREVFQNNMNTLNQILKDNGFENASLDVFVGGEQGQNPQSAEEALEEWEAQKNARSLKILEEATPAVYNGVSVPEGGLNLIV